MPNWVKNRMFINGNDEQVEKVLNTILNDEGDVDFNKIVPMPQSLGVENSSDASLGYEIIMGKASVDAKLYFAKLDKERQDKCLELGNIYIKKILKNMVILIGMVGDWINGARNGMQVILLMMIHM